MKWVLAFVAGVAAGAALVARHIARAVQASYAP